MSKLPIASTHPLIDSTAPPVATGAPMNGSTCRMMTITPMPDMKPEITEYGVNAMKRPMPTTPSRTWNSPAMMTMVKAAARLSAWSVTTTAIATAIGPVGARDLRTRPPEHRREEPHRDGPV